MVINGLTSQSMGVALLSSMILSTATLLSTMCSDYLCKLSNCNINKLDTKRFSIVSLNLKKKLLNHGVMIQRASDRIAVKTLVNLLTDIQLFSYEGRSKSNKTRITAPFRKSVAER